MSGLSPGVAFSLVDERSSVLPVFFSPIENFLHLMHRFKRGDRL